MSVDLDVVRRNQELTACIHELEEKVQALEEKHEIYMRWLYEEDVSRHRDAALTVHPASTVVSKNALRS